MGIDELGIYRSIFDERQPDSGRIAAEVEDTDAVSLLQDLLYQCDSYHGSGIHEIPLVRVRFSDDLKAVKDMSIPGLKIGQLRNLNEKLYYEIVGHHLYLIRRPEENYQCHLVF
jgi:hypothetical protein